MNAETTTLHRARVRWDREDSDLRAHTVELASQRVAGSSAPELGGDPDEADPEEMFVASLSSCHMRPRVAFHSDLGDERIESLHRRTHQRCFIANSVSCPVEVEPRA